MVTQYSAASVQEANIEPHHTTLWNTLADYWALTKPDVNLLIAITTLAGFCLACSSHTRPFPSVLLAQTLLGTLMVAAGTGTLNQYIERHYDAKMHRTARRPLAAGRLRASAVLRFGIVLSLAGGIYLALAVNVLASLLALFTLVSYLFLYTPLKRKTPFCTLVGAFPGAVPPLIGWAAAAGRLSLEAWVLYVIVWLWQFPHFMSIAWTYRDDYARANYMVLPFGRDRARFMAWQTLVPLIALIPITLLPAFLGDSGRIYLLAALLLGSVFSYNGARLVLVRSNAVARRLILVSILYLPLLFVFMILGRVGHSCFGPGW